jgi:hypothetical protein
MDAVLQKKLASYAHGKGFLFIEIGESITAHAIRHMIARVPGLKFAIGILTEVGRI